MRVVTINYDPFEKFNAVYTQAMLIYRTKIIYAWAQNSIIENAPIKEIIEWHYGYPLDPFGTKGSVNEEGIYSYPSDPDLYPIATITTAKEIIFCYEYEIICIRNKEDGKDLILRVD